MQKIPHFHDSIFGLNDNIKAEIRKRIVTRHYQAGDIILHQGQIAREAYRIESGKIKISSYTEDGREVILTSYNTGDTFGEISILDEIPSSFNAECQTDCVLNVLSAEDFLDLFHQHPQAAYEMCRKLNRQLRILYELLLEAKSMPMHKRLVSLIFRGLHSHTHEDENGLYLDMSQDELARSLGTARQSVNRELKKLEAANYLTIRSGRVYLSNLDGLRNDYADVIHSDFIQPIY